ncbi:hypothetical protein AC477_00085 [miscellaneous Crenarchaeota group-1 archaeon SG8-32-1]|uniref:Uncharacterized protein n=1 Tax=miscellaneous Crenarchaeota group-1 archaeon SG8-32-1 TaxID=1685124 RepID=A0A0M0C1F7_9ARCH|nr:MAG: hypothetical protein AC477_00085 [miscellaneous Crenarchaeota group-1 archaeon SG8-32-1]
MEQKCHFCGRTASLHWINEEGGWICSKCWDIIVHVLKRFLGIFTADYAELEKKAIAQLIAERGSSDIKNFGLRDLRGKANGDPD